jgi:LCP family protein required for cell wall assembly
LFRKRKSTDPEGRGVDARELSRDGSAARYVIKNRIRRRSRIRNIVVGILVAVAVVAGGAFAYVHDINSKLKNGLDSGIFGVLSKSSGDEPFYMLLLGTDKDEARAASSEYGSSDSSYRSDSIMLARIDPANKKVTLVSIHRDTMVDLGSHGTQKINAAYAIGGASYATQVISDFAGVPISHYAEVDMDGLAAVVDKVGGVTIDLPIDVYDPDYTGLDLKAGKQTLDGKTAALLCRARHAYDSYGDGDLYRAANQRAVITAVLKKVLSSDPVTMASTVSTMAGYVTTDMDVNSIVSLAGKFAGMDTSKDVMTGMEPTTSKYINDTWYEVVNQDAWKTMMDRVDKGLSPYESSSDDPSSGVSASTDGGSASSSTEKSLTLPSDSNVEAAYTGTVAVYNATSTDGLAGTVAQTLGDAGFTASANTATHKSDLTYVAYNGDNEAEAAGVAKTLGEKVRYEKNDGTLPTSTDVVVIVGSDYE